MKIILKEDVHGLGSKGDIVQVARGYARNYLLPRRMAEEATESNLQKLESWKKKIEQEREEERLQNKLLAEKLTGLQVRIATKSGDEGKLFGSVTNKDIAEELYKQHGTEVDKKKIDLGDPIKSLGSWDIKIKIDSEHQPSINVQVVEEEQERG